MRRALVRRDEIEQSVKGAAGGSSFVAEFAKWSAVLVTASTLLLTLLGYGHDVAYLEQFGLRAEELQRAPLDFLLRAWHPIVFVIDRFAKYNFFSWEASILKFFLARNWLWLIAAALVWAAFVYAQRSSIATRALYAVSLKNTYRKVAVTLSRLRVHFIALLIVPVLLAFVLFVGAVSYAGSGLGILWIAGVPAMSVKSGATRANDEVLNATGCISPSAKEGARCIRVVRDDKELARGYLIDYGGGRVYLYRPCDKRVIALSLERSAVEEMSGGDDLDPKKPCVKAVAAVTSSI